MLSVLSSCTSKGVVLDQETHEMGINFNSSWTALTLGEDTGKCNVNQMMDLKMRLFAALTMRAVGICQVWMDCC